MIRGLMMIAVTFKDIQTPRGPRRLVIHAPNWVLAEEWAWKQMEHWGIASNIELDVVEDA